ncbi:dUTP diphosphatase [Thermus phage G20c]|nr:dUTP diphosphatase [Thermus phage G20c]
MKHLYDLQNRLNRDFFALFPDKPKGEREVLMALVAEVGELANELKPLWAWWKPDGKIDQAKALEEAADVLFFALTLDLVRDLVYYNANFSSPILPNPPKAFHLLLLALGEAIAGGYPVAPDFLFALTHLWDYDTLESAYLRKYEVNLKRIESAKALAR